MTIEAMKQALDELESLQPIMANGLLEQRQLDFIDPHIDRAITTLRAAIEQAEKQEPVAWMYHGIRHDDTPHERPSLIWKPEYMDAMSAEKGVKATPLYTAPREWQGLTDEEIQAAWASMNHDPAAFVHFAGGALWAEARMKEKNG